jgi:hypothetical protein
MVHAQAIFAGSALEAGQRIEELRQRRVALRGQQRQALLAEEGAVRAAERAAQAEQAAAGRKLAGLAGEDAITRARAATKAANRVKRDRVRQAADLAAAITAVEEEIDGVLMEHRAELEAEARETYAAQADAVLEAGRTMQGALALLHEQATAAFALHTALGNDTRLLPPPEQIRRLERAVGELVAQVPDGLPPVQRAAEQVAA